MNMTTKLRHYALLVALASSCAFSLPAAAADVKASALFTQKVSEGNWDPPGYAGFDAAAKKHGWKSNYAEEATYDKAPEILADFASRGSNLVIAHSSGYASAVLDAAPNFPKTTFSVVSALASTKGLPNVNGWAFKWQEVGYLAGVTAGLSTKSNKVGVVCADVIPAFTQAIAGFMEGVKHVNPNAKVIVSWVGSFTDAAKAKQLTLAQISQGVDLVVAWADTAGLGVTEAIKQEKIATIGMYSDEEAMAPDQMLTSVMLNFPKVYAQIGDLYAAGKLEPKVYTLTAKDDYIRLAAFHHLTPEVETKINAVMTDIKDGKITIPDTDYKP
jgi:basic membrane protein A and related proteins